MAAHSVAVPKLVYDMAATGSDTHALASEITDTRKDQSCVSCTPKVLTHQKRVDLATRVAPHIPATLLDVVTITKETDIETKKTRGQRPEQDKQRRKKGHGEREKVMDETVTIVSLEPMKMVTKLSRKSLRAQGKSGHHNVP